MVTKIRDNPLISLALLKRPLAGLRLCTLALALMPVAAAPLPAAANTAAARSQSEFPVATDAKLEQTGDTVRLTMALSRPVDLTASLIAGPDRVVVDLPSVNFQVQPKAAKQSAGFVSAFRFGLFTADRSRIIIDLSHPALIAKAEVRSVRGGFGELVVELKRTSRAEFQAAIARNPAIDPQVTAAIPVPAKPPGETRPTIVIDPGHGGIDPGAVVDSVMEKGVVLSFGTLLKERIEADGRFRVVMTRDDDRFIALNQRVQLAREAGAALFISIHADSLTRAQEVRGATVYTGSERATDAEAARLAAKENDADAVAGLETSENLQDVAGILMDLAKRETRGFSAAFARNLAESLGGSIRMHKVPLRSAGFRVLSAPDVPSVLIELGYMSSPKDAALLNSAEWQNKAVGAVKFAIDGHFQRERAASGRAAQNSR